MVTIVLGALVDATLRRPGAALAGALLALAALGAFALGAGSRLPVLGSVAASGQAGLKEAGEGVELVLVVRGRQPIHSPAFETTLEVLATGLESNPDVALVRPGPVGADGMTTALGVVLAAEAAIDRERGAERLLADLDPGGLEVLGGGEAAVAVDLRERVEDGVAVPALAGLGAIALLLLGAGGWRLAAAGAMSVAGGAAGGMALMRLLSGAAELSGAGIAVAAAVGAVIGVEASASLQLRIRQRARSRELGEAITGVAPAASRLVAACLITAAASLSMLVADVPAARAAALAGAGAAIAASAMAAVAVPALLALFPVVRARKTARGRARRRASSGGRAVAAVLVLAAVAIGAGLAAPALGSDPVAVDATDLHPPGSATEALELARAQFPQPFGAGLGAAFAPLVPEDLPTRLFVALALAALVVALASLRWSPSPPRALVLGLAAALPAGACMGVYELLWKRPNATVMLCACASVLAVAVFRSLSAASLLARGGWGRGRVRRVSRATIPPATLASGAGLLVCGALWWALFPPLDDIALVLAVGLAADLLIVRALLVPALARARVALPGRSGAPRT